MQRYNKAFQGGAGAAIALMLSWGAQEFGGVAVPVGVEMAFAALLAGLLPALMPANAA